MQGLRSAVDRTETQHIEFANWRRATTTFGSRQNWTYSNEVIWKNSTCCQSLQHKLHNTSNVRFDIEQRLLSAVATTEDRQSMCCHWSTYTKRNARLDIDRSWHVTICQEQAYNTCIASQWSEVQNYKSAQSTCCIDQANTWNPRLDTATSLHSTKLWNSRVRLTSFQQSDYELHTNIDIGIVRGIIHSHRRHRSCRQKLSCDLLTACM